MCDELTSISIPWEVRSKAELGKKGHVGRMSFNIWFYPSLPCSNVTGNKLISSNLFCPWQKLVSWAWSLPTLISTCEALLVFFSLVQLRKGNDKSDLGGYMASSQSLPTTDTHLWGLVVWTCSKQQSSSLDIAAFPLAPSDYTFWALVSWDLLGNNIDFLLQCDKISHEVL